MTGSGNLVARPEVDFSSALAEHGSTVAFGVSSEGAMFALARASSEPLADTHDGAIFPKSRFDAPVDYAVAAWEGRQMRSTVVRGELLVASLVQPHPEGLLIAGARCSFRGSRAEQNALVADWSGSVVRRLTLGDGIEDVRVTPDGTIWVSYFDEGVFGNRGWGHPGPPPIGAPGLVAFGKDGKIKRTYDAGEAKTDDICDAYALNVVGDDDVWIYFYTDFPVVHVARRRYRVWNPEVGGARALAVHDRRLLLLGDYDDPDVVRIFDLEDDGRTRLRRTQSLVDEQGRSLSGARCVGRGKYLYVLRGSTVLCVSDW